MANAPRFGAGLSLGPEVQADDHRLHAYRFPGPGVLTWIRTLLSPLAPAPREARTPCFWEGRRVTVHTGRSLPVTADGEPVGRTPARFEVVPAALIVSVPPAGTGAGDRGSE